MKAILFTGLMALASTAQATRFNVKGVGYTQPNSDAAVIEIINRESFSLKCEIYARGGVGFAIGNGSKSFISGLLLGAGTQLDDESSWDGYPYARWLSTWEIANRAKFTLDLETRFLVAQNSWKHIGSSALMFQLEKKLGCSGRGIGCKFRKQLETPVEHWGTHVALSLIGV